MGNKAERCCNAINKWKRLETKGRKGFFESEIVVFLLGPLIFLLLVRFIGYQIFYNGDDSKERKKTVWLLSSGTAFYLLIIVILAWIA